VRSLGPGLLLEARFLCFGGSLQLLELSARLVQLAGQLRVLPLLVAQSFWISASAGSARTLDLLLQLRELRVLAGTMSESSSLSVCLFWLYSVSSVSPSSCSWQARLRTNLFCVRLVALPRLKRGRRLSRLSADVEVLCYRNTRPAPLQLA